MGNSTVTLQSVVDHARTFSEVTPVLATGGFSQQPALTIANDTMTAMLSPKMNWKFNRMKAPVFYTNSFQQDYAQNNVNIAWAEHAFIININNTALPKPIWTLEVVRDLEATFQQYGQPGQICWLPNDQLTYGTWARLTTYGQMLGVPSGPANALSQIQDPNGNYWVVSNNLTSSVTTGLSQPPWPTPPALTYPTYTSPTTPASTVNDGTVIWQAISPKGQGWRINPLPPQTGVVYQVNVICQMRLIPFIGIQQMIEPIPDDYAAYFRQGFVTHCYRHSPEMKIRGKFQDEYKIWLASMLEATAKSDRERDSAGFYPSQALLDNNYTIDVGPAWPFGGFTGI
jgi:hypothetical protein